MVRAVSCAPKSLRGRKICPTASRSPRGACPVRRTWSSKNADRDLHVDPGPVAGLAVGVDRAAVPDRAQRLDAVLDHLPPRLAVDRDDQPDAAGRVLLLGMIQPLRLQPRELRLHPGDPGVVVGRHGVTPGRGGRAAGLNGRGFHAYIYSALTAGGRACRHGPVRYEWDEAKRAANLAKHGVDFATSSASTGDARSSSGPTPYDYGEARIVAYGPLDGRVACSSSTRRGDSPSDHQPQKARTDVNKPHAPLTDHARLGRGSRTTDLSNLGPDDAPELTPELAANSQPIERSESPSSPSSSARAAVRAARAIPQAPRHHHARPRRDRALQGRRQRLADPGQRRAAQGRRAVSQRCVSTPDCVQRLADASRTVAYGLAYCVATRVPYPARSASLRRDRRRAAVEPAHDALRRLAPVADRPDHEARAPHDVAGGIDARRGWSAWSGSRP